MVDHVLQELQVGGHAADAELAQRAVHAPDRLGRGRRPGGDLDQQRIVVRRDHRAAIGGAGIQAHAEAGGAAIRGEAAVVRQEAVLRVLGRDPALQRVAVQVDILLDRHARGAHDDVAVLVARVLGHAEIAAFRDADLRLDDIDPGDHLGDRVLDLDARVDFDEIELAGIGVHQELDRAGMGIPDRAHQPHRRLAQLGPAGIVKVRRGRALHHLLVAPLHGTVALVQVHQVAMGVAERLHFDVARVAHQLLDIDLVVAERGQRLAPRRGQRALQVLLALQDAHAAPAAAPAGLEHQRIADARGQALAGFEVVRQRVGGRHHRHARLDRRIARGHLVAEPAHDLGRRADPADAGIDHGLRKVRILRQEAVARMDRIDFRMARDAQDVVDIEIGRQRLLALADQVALVSLEAMEGEAVFLGIDRHGPDIHLGRGPHDADRDLGTVGNQQRFDGSVVHGTRKETEGNGDAARTARRLGSFEGTAPRLVPWPAASRNAQTAQTGCVSPSSRHAWPRRPRPSWYAVAPACRRNDLRGGGRHVAGWRLRQARGNLRVLHWFRSTSRCIPVQDQGRLPCNAMRSSGHGSFAGATAGRAAGLGAQKAGQAGIPLIWQDSALQIRPTGFRIEIPDFIAAHNPIPRGVPPTRPGHVRRCRFTIRDEVDHCVPVIRRLAGNRRQAHMSGHHPSRRLARGPWRFLR
ncbi:hypothetical protein D9M69_130150 [compost metagenome]